MNASPLTILLQFSLISLMTIGGGFAAIPEMHRVAVDVHGWMSDETFANLFALAQAAPGPNLIIVTLIGWEAAGLLGALAATLGIAGPAFLLTYAVSRAWSRWNHLSWYRLFELGLAPITIGLILASGWLLTESAAGGWTGYAITAATAILTLRTRINPVYVLAVAGALGLLHLA